MNVQTMLDAAFAALNSEEPSMLSKFVEEWIPQAVNEINDLRNKLVILETRVLQLEDEVESLGGG